MGHRPRIDPRFENGLFSEGRIVNIHQSVFSLTLKSCKHQTSLSDRRCFLKIQWPPCRGEAHYDPPAPKIALPVYTTAYHLSNPLPIEKTTLLNRAGQVLKPGWHPIFRHRNDRIPTPHCGGYLLPKTLNRILVTHPIQSGIAHQIVSPRDVRSSAPGRGASLFPAAPSPLLLDKHFPKSVTGILSPFGPGKAKAHKSLPTPFPAPSNIFFAPTEYLPNSDFAFSRSSSFFL